MVHTFIAMLDPGVPGLAALCLSVTVRTTNMVKCLQRFLLLWVQFVLPVRQTPLTSPEETRAGCLRPLKLPFSGLSVTFVLVSSSLAGLWMLISSDLSIWIHSTSLRSTCSTSPPREVTLKPELSLVVEFLFYNFFDENMRFFLHFHYFGSVVKLLPSPLSYI